MDFNLVEVTRTYFSLDVGRRLARALGEDRGAVERGLGVAIPEVAGGIVRQGETEDGARRLCDALIRGAFDGRLLARLSTMLDGEGSSQQLADRGQVVLARLFGDERGPLIQQLASFSGLRRDSAESLLGMVAAISMAVLGRYREDAQLDATGLRRALQGQRDPHHTVTPVQVAATVNRPSASPNRPSSDAERSPEISAPLASTARPVARDGDVRPEGERDPAAVPPHVTWDVREVREETLEVRAEEGPGASLPPTGPRSERERAALRRDRAAMEGARAAMAREREALSHARETRARESEPPPPAAHAGEAASIPGTPGSEVPPAPVPHRRIEPVRSRDAGINPGRWVLPAALAAVLIVGWSLLRNGGEARRADALVAEQAGQRQARGTGDAARAPTAPPRAQGLETLALPGGGELRAPADSGAYRLALALEQRSEGSGTGGSGAPGVERIAFPALSFEEGKSALEGEALVEVDRLARVLQAYPDARVRLEGHTSGSGEVANRPLSQQRADAVRSALVERGVDHDRIQTRGHGDSDPVASADDEAGRRANARTDVILLR